MPSTGALPVPTVQDTPQKLGQQTLTDGPTLADGQLPAWCVMLHTSTIACTNRQIGTPN